MILIDHRDKRPIYEQIVEKLSDLMAMGVMEADEKLPSVRNLATELSINPNTIQKAYLELERKGFIYSVKGKGSFVSDINGIKNSKKNQVYAELGELAQKAKTMGIDSEEFVELAKRSYAEIEGERREKSR